MSAPFIAGMVVGAAAVFVLLELAAIVLLVARFYNEQKRHPEPSPELLYVPDEWVQS